MSLNDQFHRYVVWIAVNFLLITIKWSYGEDNAKELHVILKKYFERLTYISHQQNDE